MIPRHTPAPEPHALGLEAQALFERRFAAEADLAGGAEDAVPRKTVAAAAEQLHDEAVMQGIPGGGGDGGVGSDAAAGDAADDLQNCGVARVIGAPVGAAQRALEFRVGPLHTPQQ